jgi:hypothetical protein
MGAMPFAFVGGAIQLPGQFYRPLVGVILIAGLLGLTTPRRRAASRQSSTRTYRRRDRRPMRLAAAYAAYAIADAIALTWVKERLAVLASDCLRRSPVEGLETFLRVSACQLSDRSALLFAGRI